jgi:hypothetical protein
MQLSCGWNGGHWTGGLGVGMQNRCQRRHVTRIKGIVMGASAAIVLSTAV